MPESRCLSLASRGTEPFAVWYLYLSTDPVTLADDGAVTAFQEKSNIERFGRTRFEDNPDRESVSLS